MALDEEALSLAAHVTSIISTKAKLLQLKNRSGLISPIKTLPPEILAQVFVFAAESYITVDTGPPVRDLSVSQVNAISGVCSSWRRIALDTPQLWSCVHFERLHHINCISRWLERAGTHPLDIRNVVPFNGVKMSDRDVSRVSLILPRIERVRSMVLRSTAQLMEGWILGWCNHGTPRTLTTLALSGPHLVDVGFPAQGEIVDQQHMSELFHSLNTLYLQSLRVEWDLLRCHNLVTLALDRVAITAGSFRNVLINNPKLQYIQLNCLNLTDSSEPATLPLIQLRWLHTLDLYIIETCEYGIAMVAPGDCALTLKTTWYSSDTLEREFVAFCRRSNVTTLHCGELPMLQAAITAECKIEVLYFEYMDMDDIYDLIVPRTNVDYGSSSERPQSRLPYLHSIYLVHCTLSDPEGLRRVLSVCPVREIGVNGACYTNNTKLSGIDDLRKWLGPGLDVSFVMKERDVGYNPFR